MGGEEQCGEEKGEREGQRGSAGCNVLWRLRRGGYKSEREQGGALPASSEYRPGWESAGVSGGGQALEA